MGRTAVSVQIAASSEENTNLFTLSVTDTDAELAYGTLQAVIECYPEVSEVILGRTNMELLVMPSRNTIRRKEDFQKRANMKCIGEIP